MSFSDGHGKNDPRRWHIVGDFVVPISSCKSTVVCDRKGMDDSTSENYFGHSFITGTCKNCSYSTLFIECH